MDEATSTDVFTHFLILFCILKWFSENGVRSKLVDFILSLRSY